MQNLAEFSPQKFAFENFCSLSEHENIDRTSVLKVNVVPAKNDKKVNKVEKETKINCKIKSKPHAHLQTMEKKMCKVA